MRNELLSWFAREGLLLTDAVLASHNGDEEDEIKITVKAPIVALSRMSSDFRECPDPIVFGYPEESLDMMLLDDMHQFVALWFEKAVEAGIARCFVCNQILIVDDSKLFLADHLTEGRRESGVDGLNSKPWDAVFVTTELYCWLVVHFDCKRYLNRDLKGRNPFEVTTHPPEFFDLRLA